MKTSGEFTVGDQPWAKRGGAGGSGGSGADGSGGSGAGVGIGGVSGSGNLLWWEKPEFTEGQFIEDFRMAKERFQVICDRLACRTQEGAAIPSKQKLGFCIWALARGPPLSEAAHRFGVEISSCKEVLVQVCSLIRQLMLSEHVKWPEFGQSLERTIKREFELISGIQGVVGSMVPVQFEVNAVNNPADYFNGARGNKPVYFNVARGTHMVAFYVVVDHRGMFTQVHTAPGARPDHEGLQGSCLLRKISYPFWA